MSTLAAAGLLLVMLVALAVFDVRASRARRRRKDSADHASVEECLVNADHLAESPRFAELDQHEAPLP